MEDEFQTALFSLLSGDATLTTLGVTVSDTGPEGDGDDAEAIFPRVDLGEMDVRDDGSKDSDLWSVALMIHTFSAEPGNEEARAIQKRLKELLHRGSFAITGHRLVMMRRASSNLRRDPDGVRHGVCIFRALVEPA
ncbi:MAG: DUF3168 domain-containing protein [Pseudomonadota bacterium]